MRILLVLITLLAGTVQAAPLLVLGDSLAAGYGIEPEQGWVQLLRQRLDERGYGLEVVNASVSGETTSGGLSRLPALLDTHQPAVVLIELGANDGLRGTPLNIVQSNLDALVDKAQQSGARVLLIGNRLPPNYGPQYTGAFFELFARVAAQREIPLVPFLLDGVAQDWDLMQNDGYHPTAQAQPRLLENVWPALQPLLDTLAAKTEKAP